MPLEQKLFRREPTAFADRLSEPGMQDSLIEYWWVEEGHLAGNVVLHDPVYGDVWAPWEFDELYGTQKNVKLARPATEKEIEDTGDGSNIGNWETY